MDRDKVDTVTRDCAIVYNFAGQADLDESIALPKETIEQNVIGNINILESIRELPIKRYVYASSAYAVSRNGSFYGISKLTSEKIIKNIIDAIIFRTQLSGMVLYLVGEQIGIMDFAE